MKLRTYVALQLAPICLTTQREDNDRILLSGGTVVPDDAATFGAKVAACANAVCAACDDDPDGQVNL